MNQLYFEVLTTDKIDSLYKVPNDLVYDKPRLFALKEVPWSLPLILSLSKEAEESITLAVSPSPSMFC